jgi:hypothetical protein
VIGAIWLTADFVLVRCPARRWRLPGAIAAALLVALNSNVVEFATAGQAYGMCMFLLVAAFRVSILAIEREGLLLPLAAGFLSGAAASFSLLTAAATPVLLVWILRYSQSGTRLARLGAYLSGAAIPFLPVLWLFAQAPRLVFFNVIQYQALYRRVNWGDATQHDLEVLISWVDSTPALILAVLMTAGLVFIVKKSDWSPPQRAQFYLCGWLALAIGVELLTAHPTFPRYFVVAVPFLAILAVPGLYAIGWQVFNPDRPILPVLVLGVLLSVGLLKALHDHHGGYTWPGTEKVAQKVDQVTPKGGSLLADESVYFLTRRRPPSGMEFSYSHALELPPAKAATLHILSNADLKLLIAARTFNTVQTCEDSDYIDAAKLPQMYAHKAEVGDCNVFWELLPVK